MAVPAALAGLALWAVTGCSAPTQPSESATTDTSTATTTGVTSAVPGPEEVTGLLAMMIDPAVPNTEKVGKVEHGELDPGLPNRMAEATRQGGTTMTITITDTRTEAPGMVAHGTWTINNSQPLPIIVNFVAVDGTWKIERQWYCQIAYSFMVTSTACPI
ncbi:hypothetical protein OG225_40835 (plasmid) [Nocardia sp. NBC_01377]|uniref:hypothetical protein n=1 Tax=Nocardia sp. NBC_01377 TaxID=2903595 RepID=UPI002F912B66